MAGSLFREGVQGTLAWIMGLLSPVVWLHSLFSLAFDLFGAAERVPAWLTSSVHVYRSLTRGAAQVLASNPAAASVVIDVVLFLLSAAAITFLSWKAIERLRRAFLAKHDRTLAERYDFLEGARGGFTERKAQLAEHQLKPFKYMIIAFALIMLISAAVLLAIV